MKDSEIARLQWYQGTGKTTLYLFFRVNRIIKKMGHLFGERVIRKTDTALERVGEIIDEDKATTVLIVQ